MTLRNKLFIFLAFAAIVLAGIGIPAGATAALAEVTKFEEIAVMDDLTADENFKLSDYPFNQGKDLAVISLVEYCYSYRVNKQDDFSLYVYIYNPKGTKIDTTSSKNLIQFSTAQSYNKYVLKFCSVSGGDYNRLFYKFKVNNVRALLESLNSNSRQYKVSGIELLTLGDANATEYNVSKTFTYTGYASSYGPDTEAESTLNCTQSVLETIQISDLGFSSYRFWDSVTTAQQVSSVYFPVGENYFINYGTLQKIRAEWYEYMLQPVIVTNNNTLYNALNSYKYIDIGKYNSGVGYNLYIPTLEVSDYRPFWSYNFEKAADGKYLSRLNYLFYRNVSDLSDAYVSPADLESYIIGLFGYYSSPGNGYSTQTSSGSYTFDNNLIFENYVDEGRTQGYNDVTIDARDSINLVGADYGSSEWLYKWLYPDISYENIDGFSPIYEIKASDLTGTDKEISDRLLISENDVSSVKTFYARCTASKERPILFRFAVTDYTSYNLTVYKDSFFAVGHYDWAYKAQETVFMSFDIIELSFNKDEVMTVIPVVSSPINIIGDVEAPVESVIDDFVNNLFGKDKDKDWLKWLLLALGVILIAAILIPVMPYIVKFLVWLIMLPVRLVSAIAKAIKSGKRGRYDR